MSEEFMNSPRDIERMLIPGDVNMDEWITLAQMARLLKMSSVLVLSWLRDEKLIIDKIVYWRITFYNLEQVKKLKQEFEAHKRLSEAAQYLGVTITKMQDLLRLKDAPKPQNLPMLNHQTPLYYPVIELDKLKQYIKPKKKKKKKIEEEAND